MISKHYYIDDTIYLYFDFNFEFGKFDIPKKQGSYLEIIKDYLKKINFTGTKIVVMVGSIIVITLSLNNQKFTVITPESSNQNVEIVDNIEIDSFDIINDNIVIEENKVDSNNDNNDQLSINDEIQEEKNEIVIEEQKNYQEEIEQEIIKENIEEIEQQVPNEEVNVEQKEENLITIQHNGDIINIDLEEYVISVVAAEMPASFHIEALKAQSVIARTYALNKISKGVMLTDNNSTQNYIDISQMKSKWGIEFDKYYEKISYAVQSTKNITIKYNGNYIDAVYSSTSNGYTEDPINVWGNSVPYLKTVESSWDKDATSYLRTQTIDLDTFNLKLETNITSEEQIHIIERNNSGRVNQVQVGEKIYSGINFRNLLGLRSTDFDIEINNNQVIITTRGYGHGVGMSQYGANGMAQNGYNYQQILNHYYQNINIE